VEVVEAGAFKRSRNYRSTFFHELVVVGSQQLGRAESHQVVVRQRVAVVGVLALHAGDEAFFGLVRHRKTHLGQQQPQVSLVDDVLTNGRSAAP
jgi:hypothetical protein